MQFSLGNPKSTGILRSEHTSHNLKSLNLTKMSKLLLIFFFFLWSNSCSIIEEAEAEIDILEDLEQLNVKTTNDAYDDDDDDDSAFIIIESKSGAKDNVIESFFNDPKKFTKSPPRLQSSAVDSSSSSFKKFNKLSQKERKKQQKQQHSKLY